MTIILMDSNYRLDRLGVHIFFKCLLSDVCRFLQRHTSFFLMLLPLLKPKKLHLSQFDISNIFQLRYCCTQVTQLREYLEVVVLSGVSAQQSLQIVLFARKLNSRQITDKLSEQYNIAGQNNSQTYFLKHTIEPPPLDLPTILFFFGYGSKGT